MFPDYHALSARDVNLHYSAIFVQYRGLQNAELIQNAWYYVKSWRKDDQKGLVVQLISGGGRPIITSNLALDPTPPMTGYYFFQNNAHFLYRMPARVAAKGLSLENGRFVSGIAKFLPPYCVDAVKQIEEKDVHDYLKALNSGVRASGIRNAIQTLNNEAILSIPVKQEWALSLSPWPSFDFLLWHRLLPVAGVTEDQRVSLLQEDFQQEIIDEFPGELYMSTGVDKSNVQHDYTTNIL